MIDFDTFTNVRDLGKVIITKVFEKLPKVK